MRVTALLVSHDGARWLPAVLEAVAGQTRQPDRLVAVDTGSVDDSPTLLRQALDRHRDHHRDHHGDHHGSAEPLLELPRGTSFPAAVAAALEQVTGEGPTGEDEWLWLLHDDARPAEDALERLVAAAEQDPGVAVLGAKLREWPSLRRLLEVGVTISGTGRRETGLERGEYDQGQHDEARDVLAVNTAGMLVRRRVLEDLGGLDPQLPVHGSDLDLGWRAARAGHRVRVVPEAVLFHAEASARGVRPSADGERPESPRRAERRAMVHTLLANCRGWAVPLVALRLVLGAVLRALGLLLVRAPREALDEVAGTLSVLRRPGALRRGRAWRRRTSTRPTAEVRHLLAPPWLPYRHGLDLLSDAGTALVHQLADSSSRRGRRRWLTAASVLGALTVLSLVAARGQLGGGVLSGGALLPAPESVGHWWQLHTEAWHDDGAGWSDAAAGAYLLPLAVAGTLLLGQAWLVVDVLFLLLVPLAAWGAARFLRRLVDSAPARWWGAVSYALLPVLGGAVGQGRLGTVAAAVLLPWVGHAALFLGPRVDRDRRWRAAWRTALLLSLLAAFVPVAWLLALVLLVVVAAAAAMGLAGPRREWATAGTWAPLVVPVVSVPLLLLPWVVLGGRDGWTVEAGLPAPELLTDLGAWQLAIGRPAPDALGAAPAWISVLLAVAALLALVRPATRSTVCACWAVVVVGLAGAALLDGAGVWAGFPLLLAHAGAVAAAAVTADGVAGQLTGHSFGWRQPVGALAVAAALLSTGAGLVWWVGQGLPGPLDRGPAHDIPRYMTDAVARDADQGVLVVRGDGRRLDWTLVRGPGVRLGDDTVRQHDAADRAVSRAVAGLATEPRPGQVSVLSRHGVEFLHLPAPAPTRLAGNLDSVAGLSPASAVQPGSRAWQLDPDPTRPPPPRAASMHTALLVVQGLAWLVGLVLALPSRRRTR